MTTPVLPDNPTAPQTNAAQTLMSGSFVENLTGQIKASPWYAGPSAFLLQAMTATSLEQATETGELVSARDNTGVRFRFIDATFCDSDLEGQLPFYAICNAIGSTDGAACKVSVGGARVLAILFRACEMDWFPFDAEFESINLGSGMNALNLVLAPQQVQSF